MKDKLKIMFVCTGNICRSAMSEWILKKKIEQDNELKERVEVCSSGVYAENGDKPTYAAIEVMKEMNIDITKHTATNISNSKIEDMDLILCATKSHKIAVIDLYPDLRDKVYTMKEYVGYEQNDLDIKDPWGYDIVIYRYCAAELEKCIDLLIEKIKNKV